MSQDRPEGQHPSCTLEECYADCIERTECTGPARDGHTWCGMCPYHSRPRHCCGCPKEGA